MAHRSSELLNCGDAEEEKTLQDLLDAVKSPETRNRDDFDVKEVVPTPGFVVKTRDSAQRKTFINICGCSEIPAPGDWHGGKIPTEVAAALKSKSVDDGEKEALRFPLSLGAAREDVDKQGESCFVYDCLLSSDIVLAAKTHRKLRVFLIGLAIEWVSHKNDVTLSSEYKVPKMHYKGKEIQQHRIRVRRDPMVQELPQTPGETSFALPLNKAAQSHQAVQREAARKLEKMTYRVEFQNRPVDAVAVHVDLPKTRGDVMPQVWISGFELHVELPSVAEPLTIDLPFAVDSHHSRHQLDASHLLTLTLPFKPISSVLEELRQEASHTINNCILQSGASMEFQSMA